MSFDLPQELEDARAKARGFALRELTPDVARRFDEGELYPSELRKKAFEQGLFDFNKPWEMLVMMEELCRFDAGITISMFAAGFGAETILLFGTEGQKQRYLPAVSSGKAVMGFAVTEPGGGSDVAAVKTLATKSGSGYVLNGSKMFITNGRVADFLVTLVRTGERGAKRQSGLSLLIVETDREGVSRNPLKGKLGVRATDTAEIAFDGVNVPGENLVGEEGKGFYYAMAFFNISRIYTAAQAVGLAQGSLDRALALSAQSPRMGVEQTMMTLADLATRVEAARLLTYKAATRLFRFEPDAKLTSMAKVYAAETCVFVAEWALELAGLRGITGDLERSFRDAKIMEIWEGTNEMEKLIIARMLRKESEKKNA